MPHETLADALEMLDALIAEPACLPGGDLQALVRDVDGDIAPGMRARGIAVAIDIRGAGWLTGRDLRRWRYLLRQALASFADELPAGGRLHVEIGCVATTSGHRWLQADVTATTPGTGGDTRLAAPPPEGGGSRPILVETALRLLDGACTSTSTIDGRVLRLVAPVEA